jgi:hypothetical protein
MAASVVPLGSTRLQQRLLTLPARAVPPAFLATAAVLSIANRSRLRAWGWTPLDHHGVPWPSSLALLPGGGLQCLAFAGTGAALIALAVALPRSVRSVALSIAGAGLVLAAYPLDRPVGDPADLLSWIGSWPAGVHAAGFVLAGLAGLVAVAASRRRGDLVLALGMAAAAALGGTPGWYGYLLGFFAWVTVLAGRTARA